MTKQLRVNLHQNKTSGQLTSNSKYSIPMTHKLFLRTLNSDFPKTLLIVKDCIVHPPKHLQIPDVFPLSKLINLPPDSPTLNSIWQLPSLAQIIHHLPDALALL